MLVAAAVCPCPPLLVPEVATGAAPELDPARAACADALGVLAAARPDRLVVIGPAEQGGHYRQGTRGSFRGFGVDLDVRLGPGDAPGPELPASLAVAAWLLERTGWADVPVEEWPWTLISPPSSAPNSAPRPATGTTGSPCW